MKFIHAREYLTVGQCIQVECDTKCNVQLMDDNNFQAYKHGQDYRYIGGFFTHFPAILAPPHAGYWNVTLDLGGGSATIKYSITVLK